jgi:hypothetical protein
MTHSGGAFRCMKCTFFPCTTAAGLPVVPTCVGCTFCTCSNRSTVDREGSGTGGCAGRGANRLFPVFLTLPGFFAGGNLCFALWTGTRSAPVSGGGFADFLLASRACAASLLRTRPLILGSMTASWSSGGGAAEGVGGAGAIILLATRAS